MAAAAAAAVLLALPSCNNKKESSSAQKVVKINFQTGNLCGAPVHVAMKLGLFDEELAKIGQKAEYVQQVEGGATLGEMIASGKVDAGYGLYATQLQAMENGLPISFTSGIHVGCTKYYVRKDSDIQSVKDLRGKKIGVPGLADSSVMNLKRKLMDVGIGVTADNNEVEFVAYSSADLAIALNNGAVDVIGAHDPVATKGELAYGFRKILDTGTDEKFRNEYCCQQFVTHKLLRENPEGAAAVTRALQKASAYVEAEPRATAQLQIENDLVAGDLDFNAALLDELNFIPSRSLGRQTFDGAARQLQSAGILKDSTDIEKFIAQGYIEIFGVPDGYSYDKETKTYSEINGIRTGFPL
ncbi:MAG: ABC transporter substrate-binding protein [Treponema sp.]|nr:ABC transporter substrate-binding protein [Treponema sp.]MBQ5537269.1 ABC transporter substrate-binding protein [Treponema sp.]